MYYVALTQRLYKNKILKILKIMKDYEEFESRFEGEDITVEEVAENEIRVVTKSPIHRVCIFPLFGGGNSVTVITEDDNKQFC